LWKVLRAELLGPVEDFGTHGVKSQFAVRGRDFRSITASCNSEICYILKVPLFLHPGLFSVYTWNSFSNTWHHVGGVSSHVIISLFLM